MTATIPAMRTSAGTQYIGANCIISFRGEEYYVERPNPKYLNSYSFADGKACKVPRVGSVFVRFATEADKQRYKELSSPAGALYPGALVRIPKGSVKLEVSPTDLLVVLKQSPSSVSLAKLGGDNGFYLRVSPSMLEKVDPADVLK